MKEAVISAQWESLADLSHKMMSPCKHIGAIVLYELLGKIEKCIRNNSDTGSVQTLISESLREFESVSEILNEHISKMN